MAIVNKFRNIFLKNCLQKFQTASIRRSSDKCDDPQNIKKENNKDQCIEALDMEKKNSPPEPKRIFSETEEEKRKRQLQKCKVLLREPDNYFLISGVPIETTCFRGARVYQPRKNAMQSGTYHIGHWEIDFETKERWENPLMGWCSSGDDISNIKLRFSTKEQAIEFCKKNNMKYWIQESTIYKKLRIRSYASNFHHKSRTRLSTK